MKIRRSARFKKKIKQEYSKNNLVKMAIIDCIFSIQDDRLDHLQHSHQLNKELSGLNSFAPLGKKHDLRIIYKIVGDVFVFIDIGSHRELYG